MTPGDQGRPSLPHHQVRTTSEGHRVVQRNTPIASVPEPRTITIALDEIPEDLQAFARSTGLSIETLIKGFSLGSKVAVALTRADDRLVVDLEKGKLGEKLDSLIDTKTMRRRIVEWAAVISLVVATATSIGQAIWHSVAPRAREAAEVAVIAPAIEAKRVAEVAVDRTDLHAARLTAIEASQSELAASVEKLNGAVVMLLARLPEPPPTRVEVPASIEKRGRR